MLIHFIHGYYCIYRPWQPLTYLYFPYHCISLIYFSFTKIRMFLYAQIYWLEEFGDVSCLQFNYLRVETLTPTWEDLVGHLSDNLVGHLSDNLVGHLSDNLVGHLSVWSPTKLCVRPECLIVDTGICKLWRVYLSTRFKQTYFCLDWKPCLFSNISWPLYHIHTWKKNMTFINEKWKKMFICSTYRTESKDNIY